MRSFEHIANLIRSKRLSHPKGFSQSELSNLLGYKNGQFISNVERGLCSIPLKMLSKVCQILDIEQDDMKEALLKDLQRTIDNYMKINEGVVRSQAPSKDSSQKLEDVFPRNLET